MAANADLTLRLLADVSRAEQALRRVSGELRSLDQVATRAGGGTAGAGIFDRLLGRNALNQVQRQAQRQASGVRQVLNRAFNGVGGGIGQLTSGLVAGGIIGAPIAAGAFAISQAFEWQDAWMEVIKTVGSGAQDMGLDKTAFGLAKSLGFSPQEVAKTMAIGGQLNVPVSELANFTEVMLKAGVATDMTSESAAQMAGQFAAAMRTADPDKWNKILSTTAQLADALPGGETMIMDTAQRFALAGKSLGLNESQVIGLAAFTQGIGIDPEMGGSSLSRLFLNLSQAGTGGRGEGIPDMSQVRAASDKVEDVDAAIAIAQQQHSEMYTKRGKLKKGISKSSVMAADENLRRLRRERPEAAEALDNAKHPGLKDAKVFAEMAGMSVEDFGQGVRTDPFGTFRRVLGGLQQKDQQGTLIAALQPLGIDNIRDIQTLLPLVQGLGGKDNMPGLDDVMAMAAGEYANPQRLSAEAAARGSFDVTKARQARAGLQVSAIGAGTQITPGFVDIATRLVNGADELINKLNGLLGAEKKGTVFEEGAIQVNASGAVALGPESLQWAAGQVADAVKQKLIEAWNVANSGSTLTGGEQLGGAFSTP